MPSKRYFFLLLLWFFPLQPLFVRQGPRTPTCRSASLADGFAFQPPLGQSMVPAASALSYFTNAPRGHVSLFKCNNLLMFPTCQVRSHPVGFSCTTSLSPRRPSPWRFCCHPRLADAETEAQRGEWVPWPPAVPTAARTGLTSAGPLGLGCFLGGQGTCTHGATWSLEKGH